jgi:hypothetical protein
MDIGAERPTSDWPPTMTRSSQNGKTANPANPGPVFSRLSNAKLRYLVQVPDLRPPHLELMHMFTWSWDTARLT